MNKIELLMQEKGYNWSQAKYASEPGRRADNKQYKPIERREYKADDPMFKNYRLTLDPITLLWHFYRKDREKKISIVTTKQGYTHLRSTVNYKGVTYQFSLGQLIWLLYLKKDIPKGYAVDHIDGNPFNNMPYNFQLLTTRQNLRKTVKNENFTTQNTANII